MAKEKKAIGFLATSDKVNSPDLAKLAHYSANYKAILANTTSYRADWNTHLRQMLQDSLTQMSQQAGLDGEIVVHAKMDNLAAVQFTLGSQLSGMAETVTRNVHRSLIKHNGSLVYQQLFNGKVMVVINLPHIEGYGQPSAPTNVAILRPNEISADVILAHLERFIQAITGWEDFDDDEPRDQAQAIGFRVNFEQENPLQPKA